MGDCYESIQNYLHYSDPSSFSNLRNKSNFYYYFLHGESQYGYTIKMVYF